MEFKLRLNPLDVCFSGIAVEEVPCDIGLREGYFAMPIFAELQSHTRNNGAGGWCEIDIDNIVLGGDIAAIESLLPRITPDGTLTNDMHFGWMDGRIEWDIPLGWGEQNSSGTAEPFKNFADGKKAEMRLFEDGRSGVRKFQHQIMRYINGDIYLDMRKVEQ
jgi:hypothetical protein